MKITIERYEEHRKCEDDDREIFIILYMLRPLLIKFITFISKLKTGMHITI